MIIRINFNKKRAKVMRKTRVTLNFNDPVVMLSEIIHRMDKLKKENVKLKKENAYIKRKYKDLEFEKVTHQELYKVASEYVEDLESEVDILKTDMCNIKENIIELEIKLMKMEQKKTRKPKKEKKSKHNDLSSLILKDSTCESDESILFEICNTYENYLTRDDEGYPIIDWIKLERRVGKKIIGNLDLESYWGYPILNGGVMITEDDVKGLRGEIKEATINARRG